jgi:adenosylcobinamide-GDP ribazoletransferase
MLRWWGCAAGTLPAAALLPALCLLGGVAPALAVPLWLGRRLGGHSGDSYGACVEWSAALALMLSAATRLLAVPPAA